jgi:hypothetical protein
MGGRVMEEKVGVDGVVGLIRRIKGDLSGLGEKESCYFNEDGVV